MVTQQEQQQRVEVAILISDNINFKLKMFFKKRQRTSIYDYKDVNTSKR